MMKVGFIGAGNMGSALARAAVLADGTTVYLYDKDESKAKSVAVSILQAYNMEKNNLREAIASALVISE